MRWTFIGGGNMASSLIGGLLGDGAEPNTVQVFDVDPAQRQRVSARFGVSCIESIAHVGANDCVVIAVKPDKVSLVCQGFAGRAPADTPQLFLSVAAGVTAASMQGWLPADAAIIRTMPNTPALLGLGATALFANAACTEANRSAAQSLLQAAGMTVWVENEAQLDAVTALSGSGPAYFFYLLEQMIDSAVKLGLSRDSATALAIQTALGAATMARDAGPSPTELRQQVTSKGGTTHAAISTFDSQELPATVHAAMQAAFDRAVELGKEFGDNHG